MRAKTIIICVALSGCASVVSTRHEATTDSRAGLLYYLPSQDIILTVTVAKPPPPPPASTPPAPWTQNAPAGGAAPGDGTTPPPTAGGGTGTAAPGAGGGGNTPATPTPPPFPGFTGSKPPYTVNVTTTPSYPDRSKAFWLSFGTNWLGNNALDIGVSTIGLLQTATSTTEPGISDALTGLARAVAINQSMAVQFDDESDDPCTQKEEGTYVYRIPFPTDPIRESFTVNECSFAIVAKQITMPVATLDTYMPERKSAHGVYYRQAIPYVVTLTGNEMVLAGVLTSPSQSGQYFLPVESTVFAKNSAEFGFKDGVPTKFKQEADGEIVGFLKLPADIIAAYFGAIGEMFTGFAKEPEGDAALIAAQTELEYARFRQEQCVAAIQAKDSAAIEATCSAPAAPAK